MCPESNFVTPGRYLRALLARARLSAVHNFVACNKVAGCCFCGKTTGSLPLLLEPARSRGPLSLRCCLPLLRPPPSPSLSPEPIRSDRRGARCTMAAFSRRQLALANPLCSPPIAEPPSLTLLAYNRLSPRATPPAFGAWKNRPPSLLSPPSRSGSSAPACSRTLVWKLPLYKQRSRKSPCHRELPAEGCCGSHIRTRIHAGCF